eukprot:SAG11_NODE_24573_length_371_cov_1.106618_1_plen_107_part_01
MHGSCAPKQGLPAVFWVALVLLTLGITNKIIRAAEQRPVGAGGGAAGFEERFDFFVSHGQAMAGDQVGSALPCGCCLPPPTPPSPPPPHPPPSRPPPPHPRTHPPPP